MRADTTVSPASSGAGSTDRTPAKTKVYAGENLSARPGRSRTVRRVRRRMPRPTTVPTLKPRATGGFMALDPITLGRRLREARENRRLTQEQAAQAIGISRTALVHIEAG